MSNAFLGQISMFAGNYPPKFTAFCNGQLLPITQNTALFSLLGTTYGGDGRTTFALPDLRSRLPVHQGQGPGLSPYSMGQEGGESAVTLIQSTLPSHSHLFSVTAADASAAAVGSNMLPAKPTAPEAFFYAVSPASPNPPLISQTLAIESCGSTGGNQAHPNLMPSQCISFIIYLQGIFPSRN